MKPGNLAPEFTLKDLDGKNFDLSSLRGKYVVLDFWGSWCGLWRQRMKIWNGPSRKDDSGKTCTTVWQRWKSGCHLWPSVLMTFCLWRNFSVNGFPKNLRKRQKAFQKMPYTDFVLIVGRAMSGNCRTGSNGRCCLRKPLYWSCRT